MTRAGCGRLVAVLLALSCASFGCAHASSDQPNAAVRAASQLAAAKRGTIDFRLTASTPGSSEVGFHIAGSYVLDPASPYPTLDFTYQRSPAAAGSEVVVRSTGSAVYAGTPGTLVQVPEAKVAALRLGERGAVVGDFSFDDWVRDPQSHVEGEARVTTGSVNAVGFLSDLVRIAAPVSGVRDLRDDQSAGERLQHLVHDGNVRIVTDAQTDELRTLHVDVSFAPNGNDELRAALGDYGGVRVVVDLQFAPLQGDLQVEVPH